MKTIKIQMTDVWAGKDGKEPENNSPVLNYCRKLISAGEKKNTCLEVYRGEVLALKVSNIGEAAKFRVHEKAGKPGVVCNNGPKFVKFVDMPENLKKKWY